MIVAVSVNIYNYFFNSLIICIIDLKAYLTFHLLLLLKASSISDLSFTCITISFFTCESEYYSLNRHRS